MSVAVRPKNRKPKTENREWNDPEVALMLRVQRDEPDAFAELIERYWLRVFSSFYRRLGDRQEAEDLAQDVFLRLYRHRKRYLPRARFTTSMPAARPRRAASMSG